MRYILSEYGSLCLIRNTSSVREVHMIKPPVDLAIGLRVRLYRIACDMYLQGSLLELHNSILLGN